MEVLCKFQYYKISDGRMFYTCFINSQKIPENVEFRSVGCHELKHSNKDVRVVVFHYCEITKVPQRITKLFPNIQDLSIWNSNLEKITKDDLYEYKNLESIAFCGSKIKTLSGNIFEDFHNLHEISFSGNILELIELNILDGLNKLTYVNFSRNVNYNEFYSIIPNNVGNITLEELKNELYRKFCKNPGNIRRLIKTHKEEIKSLKEANEILIKQNQALKISDGVVRQEIQKVKELNAKLDSQIDLNNEIQKFLIDDSLVDFKIIIGDHEFDVHKFLLIARSPTLADILRNNPYAENLNLIDIPVNIFEKVLNFIYTGEYSCEGETNLLQLLGAAGRLKIKKLQENVANKILDKINSKNALEVLNLSNKYDHNELRKKSFMKIKEMYPQMCFMDEWAFQTEQVTNAIELFKEKEEAIRKIEENFRSKMKRK